MKEVSSVESISKLNIDFKVRNKNTVMKRRTSIKTIVVFGLLIKLKNGPIIVKINPSVEEIKNLGNRNTLSQKSDILSNYKALH